MKSSQVEDIVTNAMSKGSDIDEMTLADLRSCDITKLLQAFKPFLCHDDHKVIRIALYILVRSSVDRPLECSLSALQVEALLGFLCEKTSNFMTIDSAVDSVALLISRTDESLISDKKVLTVLIQNFLSRIHTQSLLLTARRSILIIYEKLLSSPSIVAAIEYSFVGIFSKSFVAAFDGERDPQLRLRAFELHQQITTCFSADQLQFLVDDLFESIASYFPLTFTPPADCPVSSEDLRQALHNALLSPLFGDICVPFLCNKLGSPSGHAKAEALTMIHRISTGTRIKLGPHIPEIFGILRNEALKAYSVHNEGSTEMLKEILKTIQAIATQCSSFTTDMQLSLMDPIVRSTISTIETDGSSGRFYATLLHTLAKSHSRCCVTLTSYIFPLLVQYISKASSHKRLTRLENCLSCYGALLASIEVHIGVGQDSTLVSCLQDNAVLRPEIEFSLRETSFNVLKHESSAFLVRVAAESLATWIAVSKRVLSWGSPDREICPTSAYQLLVKRCFSADIDSETSFAVLTAVVNVSKVDLERASDVLFPTLTEFRANEKFVLVVREIGAGAPGLAEPAIRMLIALDFDTATQAAQTLLLTFAAQLPYSLKVNIIRLSSQRRSLASFNLCVDAMKTLEKEVQVELCRDLVDHGEQFQCGIVVSGAQPEVLSELSLNTEECLGYWYDAAHGSEQELYLISLRVFAEMANKLYASLSVDELLKNIPMLAATAKGLLSRGDSEKGDALAKELFQAVLGANHRAAIDGIVFVLSPPALSFTARFWKQRFFQKGFDYFVSMDSQSYEALGGIYASDPHGRTMKLLLFE